MARAFRWLTAIVLLLIAGGFAAYLVAIASMRPDESAEADAIVVLTGGGARVETALRLLEEGRGRRLLVSGVSASDAAIRAMAPADAARFDCCVDLDRVADSTATNARETARWTAENHYRRVILVTHAYHMPRATLELSAAAPDVEIVPWPVGDWREPGLRQTILEYAKLGVVAAREGATRLRERI